jgi:hypothetical protein
MPSSELIWRGRMHLGDEPGVYGDASYAGLSMEWPLTLRKFQPEDEAPGRITFRIEAEDVRVFAPHRGHRVVFSIYFPDPAPDDLHRWTRMLLEPTQDFRIAGAVTEFDVHLPPERSVAYLSLRIEVDTTVHPGLCDEFVVARISMRSPTHYGSLGFQYDERAAKPRAAAAE